MQRKYKCPIEKASGWLQVVFVFSMGNGEHHQKSTLNKLIKKGRKEEYFLYLRCILANIDLKMQKSGKLLEAIGKLPGGVNEVTNTIATLYFRLNIELNKLLYKHKAYQVIMA